MENNVTRSKLLAPALAAFAIATLAVLAIALPQGAWAASASDQMAAGSADLSAQADSETMWVLTEIKTNYNTNNTYSNTFTTTYAYNAKGLLVQEKADSRTTTYAYDKKNRLKSSTNKTKGYKATKTKYTLNKKGWVVKAKSSGSKTAVKYKYDKKGRFLKMVLPKASGKDQTISYDKKGNISKMTSSGYKATYKNDPKGNATKVTRKYSSGKSTETFDNKYDENGLLTAVVHSVSSGKYKSTDTYSYTYQQITVPKAAQKMVKNQQWTLLQQQTHNGWPFIFTAHP